MSALKQMEGEKERENSEDTKSCVRVLKRQQIKDITYGERGE